MNMQLKRAERTLVAVDKAANPKKKHTYKVLFAAWVFLVACGIIGTKLYSDHLRNRIASQIGEQTKQQLDLIQKNYEAQVSGLKTNITQLESKVDSLTEMLAFAKDSANSKTDNSNQLYTQLSDLKKKLDDLQKNLDAIK